MKSIKVNFKGKYAKAEFDESVISAQEVARAMAVTPHMMGKDMQYGGILLLSVAGVNDEATGKKVTTALSKVEGVAKVTLYSKQQAVGIQFTGKGKVTSKQLIEALEAAGLKGAQYGTASGSGGQAMNGGHGSMPDHAGMAMGKGGPAPWRYDGSETWIYTPQAQSPGVSNGVLLGSYSVPWNNSVFASCVRGGCGCYR
jgi:copper chaperone CopZ